MMAGFEMDDRRKIGIGLTAFGVFFTGLGVLFFFDKGLLAMGNLLFVSGVIVTIGVQSTVSFFLRKKNRSGSAFFLGGMVLVLMGWAIVGMVIQTYGFIQLFRGFLPTVFLFLQRIPVLGWILDQPFMRQFYSTIREQRLPD